jgi:hypothetical protein
MRLTVLARRAFQHDRVLGPLNLSVKVRDGVATVWGPVPSAEVGRQAVARLEAINGIYEVRSDLHLRKPADKPLLAELGIPTRVPDRIEVAKPLTNEPEKPAEPGPKTRASAARTAATVVGNDSRRDRRPGKLPELKTMPVPGDQSQPKVTVVAARPSPVSLDVAVERLRSSESRFRSIQVEVRGSMVVVSRSGAFDEDVMALAQALRRVRGVTEVLVTSE